MAYIQVFIEDQTRGQHIRTNLDLNRRIAVSIEALVKDYGLPRRNLQGQPLEYHLVRALDGQTLPSNKNLYELGIANREVLNLVCPQARETWITIQEILEQIEAEITDQVSGKIKDRVTKKVWRSVKQKLEQLERTHSDDPRLKRIRRWVNFVEKTGGIGYYIDQAGRILEPFNFKAFGIGLVQILLAVALSTITYRVADASITSLFPENTITVTQIAPQQTPAETVTTSPLAPTTPATAIETVEVVTSIPPTPCVHPANWVKIVVRPGDTLRSLAHTYDSSIHGLMAGNCLTDDRLVVGSELYVPRVPPRTATPRPIYRPPVYPPPILICPRRPVKSPTVPTYEPVTTELPVQYTLPPAYIPPVR